MRCALRRHFTAWAEKRRITNTAVSSMLHTPFANVKLAKLSSGHSFLFVTQETAVNSPAGATAKLSLSLAAWHRLDSPCLVASLGLAQSNRRTLF